MTIYNQNEHATLHHADCLTALRDGERKDGTPRFIKVQEEEK